MNEYEYIKAYLRYKKFEKSLKDLPKKERELIMRIYQIEKPQKHSQNIIYRALEGRAL